MNNCGHDDKDFPFEVSREDFDKTMREPHERIKAIQEKLGNDIEHIKTQLQNIRDELKKADAEGKELCKHEMLKLISPLLDEAMKVLMFTTLFNDFNKEVIDANELVSEMLDGLAELSFDAKRAKKAVNLIRIKKKSNWFF